LQLQQSSREHGGNTNTQCHGDLAKAVWKTAACVYHIVAIDVDYYNHKLMNNYSKVLVYVLYIHEV